MLAGALRSSVRWFQIPFNAEHNFQAEYYDEYFRAVCKFSISFGRFLSDINGSIFSRFVTAYSDILNHKAFENLILKIISRDLSIIIPTVVFAKFWLLVR